MYIEKRLIVADRCIEFSHSNNLLNFKDIRAPMNEMVSLGNWTRAERYAHDIIEVNIGF